MGWIGWYGTRPRFSKRWLAVVVVMAVGLAGLVTIPTAYAVDEPPLGCHEPKAQVNEPPDINMRFPALGATGGWRHLDLFLPRNGPPGANGKHPIVIWVHGGAWNSYDQTIGVNEGVLQRLNEGWAIASVDFRTACEDNNGNPHPTQVLDIYLATIWLREVLLPQLAEHNLDGDRLLLMGGSSGAHLASLAGTAANQTSLSDRLPYIGIVSLYGIYDLQEGGWMDDTIANPPPDQLPYKWPYMARAAAYLLGCDNFVADCTAQQRAAASPLAFLDADDPPMLVMHGKADQLVEYDQAFEFYTALTAVRGAPAPTDTEFQSNGTDSFVQLRSTHHLTSNFGGCTPYPGGQLGDGDHGCIFGNNGLAATYLAWLATVHG